MPQHQDEDPSPVIVAAFLERLLEDRRAGRVRSLEEYVRLFPGHESTIRHQKAIHDEVSQTADEDSAPPAPPPIERIGHYRILREIGHGGQGIVYLARDENLGRDVALKVLTAFGRASPQIVERFRREAVLASRLDHPGLCPIHDAGEQDGLLYIAMRFVEGETLRQKIRRAVDGGGDPASLIVDFQHSDEEDSSEESPHVHPTDLSRSARHAAVTHLLEIFEDCARALQSAHERGIVHRDIKPGNIMIARDGHPVILDFGLAHDVGGNLPTITQTGDLFGTPPYMSPEQVAARHIEVDQRSDVYSLAVSLYECLTLRRPFLGPTREKIYQAILKQDPPDPRPFNDAISLDLKVVIETALEKDLARRYSSAEAFADELRRVRLKEPILARPAGPWLRTVRWAQRNPIVATASAVLFFTLSIGLAVSLVLLRQVSHEKEQKVLALEREQEERERSLLALDHLRLSTMADRIDELWPMLPRTLRGENGIEAYISLLKGIRARIPSHAENARQWNDVQPLQLRMVNDLVRSRERISKAIETLERRRERTLEIQRESLVLGAAAWKAAAERVMRGSRCRTYRGLHLAPLPGLLPLGPDPTTGLEEFANLASGTAPRRNPDDGRLVITEDTGIVLVLLPGGTFMKGTPEGRPFRNELEIYEEVSLDPFLMGKYEITQGQWLRIMGENPSQCRPGNRDGFIASLTHPVESITFFDARRFARRCALRLPTHVEWEYAIRNDLESKDYELGDDFESLEGHANLRDLSYQSSFRVPSKRTVAPWEDGWVRTCPVDTFFPNAFGLHELSGNVSEWVLTHGRPSPGPENPGEDRAYAKGSSFNSAIRYLARCAQIMIFHPRTVMNRLGLRLARDLKP